MTEPSPGPVLLEKETLHQSGLNTLSNCGEQYRRRWIENDRRPPGAAAHIGTGVHGGAELAMKRKVHTGELPDLGEVKERAADRTERAFRDGVMLTKEQKSMGLPRVRGFAMDRAVQYSTTYMQEIAPHMKPVKVEHRFRITSEDLPVDLAGRIDLLEDGVVRDLKTAAKKPSDDIATKSLQGAIYTMAATLITGKSHHRYEMDYVVKSKVPYAAIRTATFTDDAWESALRRTRIAWSLVEHGDFLPANPDWWGCSEKWCGYFDDCWAGRRARVQM